MNWDKKYEELFEAIRDAYTEEPENAILEYLLQKAFKLAKEEPDDASNDRK